jgi:predicted O-methyltransferase YrrM
MNFDQKKLNRYCEEMSTKPDTVLNDLERETYLKTMAPQMLTGHTQGVLLQFIAQMIKPHTILEIGTFTGYAALCMAKGLSEDGKLHTIEVNPERRSIIEKYIAKANLENKVILHLGDAKKIIPAILGSFDMVYVDAAKFDYQAYYDLVVDRMSTGGMIVVDNVLWGGKIVGGHKDKDTQVLLDFNSMVESDSRVENVVLPIRDGITLIRRK